MTSMPEAAKLQGPARTKVSELISSFNALITTQTDWRASDAKVNDSLTALLGPDVDQAQAAAPASGVAGATGTTGTEPAVQVDPAIRSKLVEFRTHLKEFEKAAGGAAPSPASTAAANEASPAAAPPAAAAAPPTGSTPPSSAPASATPPAAAPASATPPAAAPASAASSATPSATGTTGSSEQNVNEAARAELAAIDAILAKSKTGALTKTETSELKQHVEALRALLK
jgi:hypothetical protein